MHRQVRKIILTGLFLMLPVGYGFGQMVAPPNLPHLDSKPIHLGFMVGTNIMDNLYHVNFNTPALDTLSGANIAPHLGFQLGVLMDMRLFSYANLRLLVTIMFGDRTYRFFRPEPDGSHTILQMPWESVYLTIPLHLKLRAKRWNNFRPYLIGGLEYTFDLASLRKIEPHEEDDILVRVKDNDVLSVAGVGFDFYLPYFKFAIELTTSSGMRDVLIHENTLYSNALSYLKSRFFRITITFEG